MLCWRGCGMAEVRACPGGRQLVEQFTGAGESGGQGSRTAPMTVATDVKRSANRGAGSALRSAASDAAVTDRLA